MVTYDWQICSKQPKCLMASEAYIFLCLLTIQMYISKSSLTKHVLKDVGLRYVSLLEIVFRHCNKGVVKAFYVNDCHR